MNKFAKVAFKALLVVTLFTGGSVILSTSGVKSVSEANAATYNQVNEYLISNGYTVITLNRKEGTRYDWIATTTKNKVSYSTTIYCTETSIIGNTDVPL